MENKNESLAKQYGITADEIRFAQERVYKEQHIEFINKVNQFILDNIKVKFEVGDLANHLEMSKSTLDKKIRRLTGRNITQYVREFRLDFSIKLMERGIRNVNTLFVESGFNSAAYYSISFKKYKGIGAKKYMRRFSSNPNSYK